MKNKIDFDSEVEIQTSCTHKEYIGCKGIVIGISEEDGVIYSYAVSLLDGESGLCFSPDCLKPTGKQFKREDFY